MMEKVTIRLNGSSYINDMELNDRYKVINESLWISLLSLVGNPEGPTVTTEEPVSPLLTMDLEKRFAESLEENPAEFLVVDMCYSAGHRLCLWNGQVFTKNPKLVESKFYEEHMDEIQEIDVMRDQEFDWKLYMDRYIDLVSQYFDKHHIILVKSRCPLWYVTHTHVRRFPRKSRPAYNKRIKEFEDYFVEKLDPYVVDIYSHYYIDFNYKKGVTMSTYEKPFYHHAKRLVSTIIRTQPKQRVFSNQEYFIRLGRFIKYYHNLFAKNNTSLMMDDKQFLDHLVLQMGRPLLAEYESDFVEIEKCGYGSIDEILETYNFKFAASLKDALQVIKAVEQGDLFRDGVRYEMIYEYDMKIVHPFVELVKELVKQHVGDNALEKTNLNETNAWNYYVVLRAEKRNKSGEAKKQVLSIGKKVEEKTKIKELLKVAMKENKSVYLACIHAMNQYYQPILLDLWGSCITREILNEDDWHFRIGKYAYRNSFLFAFDEPISSENVDFSNLSLFENSPWRVGYIRSAFEKDLPKQLSETQSKWLLLDFYDLICDVVQYKGGYLTADSEVRGLKFYKKIKDDCTLTTVEEVLSDEEIKERMKTFIAFIKERYGNHIIFIRGDVKLNFLNFRRRLKPMLGHKKPELQKKKKFLNKWQDYFEKQLDCHVIDNAKDYCADDLCVSGAFMVHYEKEFYEKSYAQIKKIICKENGKK